MLSNKSLLPSFFKTVFFAVLASFSLAAFAGDDAEKKVDELKDMATETEVVVEMDESTSMVDADATEGDEEPAPEEEAEAEAEE